jgi:hypothetical protein
MPLHQPAFEGGGMVPYRRSTELPLLPFEKRLIHELGVTEEEYRRFADEVRAKPYRRPEEYAHVPDVQNCEVVAVHSALFLVCCLQQLHFCWHQNRSNPRHQTLGERVLAGNQDKRVLLLPLVLIRSSSLRNTGKLCRSSLRASKKT